MVTGYFYPYFAVEMTKKGRESNIFNVLCCFGPHFPPKKRNNHPGEWIFFPGLWFFRTMKWLNLLRVNSFFPSLHFFSSQMGHWRIRSSLCLGFFYYDSLLFCLPNLEVWATNLKILKLIKTAGLSLIPIKWRFSCVYVYYLCACVCTIYIVFFIYFDNILTDDIGPL